MVTIPMNRTGIKFLIADFEMMFGRSSGKIVQALCINKNWPLVWARNPRIASVCQTDGHLPNCSQGCWNVHGDCQALPFGSALTQCVGGGSCSTPGDRASQRILDPEVLMKVPEGHNCTSGVEFETAKKIFRSAWLTVNEPVLPFASTLKHTWLSVRWSTRSALSRSLRSRFRSLHRRVRPMARSSSTLM